MAVGDSDATLDAERGSGGDEPILYTVDQAEQQTIAIADTIEAMCSQGHCYRDQAVLCTGNEKLSKLAQDLEHLGVPILFLGSLFERQEIKDVLALLSILIDRRAIGLVRLACWSEFAMQLDDVAMVIDYLQQHEDESDIWLDKLATIPGLSELGRTALTAIAQMLAGFSEQSSPWTVLTTVLLDRTKIAAQIAGSGDIRDRSRGIALWQLMNFIRSQPSSEGLPITRLLNRVRRLVRLGDDRDLRQLPAAAQNLDSVRLMTIHGSKGLEFPVVHLPGLNVNTLPRTPQLPACSPPDGMIEGSLGTAREMFRSEQALEQECLFYVALSRARDRLFLYAPTQKANGHQWGLSPFLARLGDKLKQQHITPKRTLPEVTENDSISLLIEGGLQFSAAQIGLYEACPRRFFYTHVLQIGGRRKETALMQMHEIVRTLTQTLIAEGRTADPDSDLEQWMRKAMIENGLKDDDCAEELTTFAVGMLQFLMSQRLGYTPVPPPILRFRVANNAEITVRPDDVLIGSDGKKTFRRIQTGHSRSMEKDVGTAAFAIAVQQDCPDAAIEFVYLADQTVQSIVLSDKELQTRSNKLEKFFNDVSSGHFPTAPSTWTCPSCPAFFICGSAPAGSLSKKF